MDIKRVFDGLRQWSRGLDADQSAVLGRLMAAAEAKDLADIPVEDVRKIQEQLLRSGVDADRQQETKRAIHHLTPVVSGDSFI